MASSTTSRLALLAACCVLPGVVDANPQVIAYERVEAMHEWRAMLARMDTDDDKKLSRAEMDAIEDHILTDVLGAASSCVSNHCSSS